MILHFDLKINDLIQTGKNYAWPRPAACPCCDGKLWGHGYTRRYFPGSSKPLWLKRYLCTGCGAVHTLRPKTHWRRFQSTLATIIESLRTKIIDNHWLEGIPRQRQQYWWRGFKIQLARNATAFKITSKHLRNLLTKHFIAATHSLRWFQVVRQGTLTGVPAL